MVRDTLRDISDSENSVTKLEGRLMDGKRIITLTAVCCVACLFVRAAGRPDNKPIQPSHAKLIPTEQLKEDLDSLIRAIGDIHPNMYAQVDKAEFTEIVEAFHRRIDHAMEVSEFYLYIRTLVQCLGDSHTRIETPPGFKLPQITESMRQFGARLRQLAPKDRDSRGRDPYIPAPRHREYTRPYSHHFFPEENTCLVVINTFGRPDQTERYSKAFRETFKTAREKGTTNLVIDIRENSGGCGLTAAKLLKYLASKPFRQIESIEQRLGPELHELCEEHGLDLNRVMAQEYGIDLEGLKSRGEYRSRMTVVGQEPLKTPHGPADRFKGTVYLLIAKPTFSAASNFAATVKHYGLATLIGQETSGERDHYGSVVWIQLPHSKLKGQVSTAHMITVGGMEDRGGVKPDYEIRQKPDDRAKGVDTALQFTLRLIKGDCDDQTPAHNVSMSSD